MNYTFIYTIFNCHNHWVSQCISIAINHIYLVYPCPSDKDMLIAALFCKLHFFKVHVIVKVLLTSVLIMGLNHWSHNMSTPLKFTTHWSHMISPQK